MYLFVLFIFLLEFQNERIECENKSHCGDVRDFLFWNPGTREHYSYRKKKKVPGHRSFYNPFILVKMKCFWGEKKKKKDRNFLASLRYVFYFILF